MSHERDSTGDRPKPKLLMVDDSVAIIKILAHNVGSIADTTVAINVGDAVNKVIKDTPTPLSVDDLNKLNEAELINKIDLNKLNQYDAIFTDYNMNDKEGKVHNGDEFIRILRKAGYTGKIIGMSGDQAGTDKSGEDAAFVMVQAGANAFITKPATKEAIQYTLDTLEKLFTPESSPEAKPGYAKNVFFPTEIIAKHSAGLGTAMSEEDISRLSKNNTTESYPQAPAISGESTQIGAVVHDRIKSETRLYELSLQIKKSKTKETSLKRSGSNTGNSLAKTSRNTSCFTIDLTKEERNHLPPIKTSSHVDSLPNRLRGSFPYLPIDTSLPKDPIPDANGLNSQKCTLNEHKAEVVSQKKGHETIIPSRNTGEILKKRKDKSDLHLPRITGQRGFLANLKAEAKEATEKLHRRT